MAAKGGIWTKKGFVKAADGGTAVAVADTDPALQLASIVSSNLNDIADEAEKMLAVGNASGDNAYILRAIAEESRDSDPERHRGIVVKSKDGETQALLTLRFRRDEVHIDFLATHPRNADRSSPDAVRGAGTQAVARAAKIAQERGQRLGLTSMPQAEGFYEKLGFENIAPDPTGGKFILTGKNLEEIAAKAK